MSAEKYVLNLMATGRFSFTLQEANAAMGGTLHNTKVALNRLSKKGMTLSFARGFYIVIPPSYAAQGITPPDLYIHALMRYLDKPYYVALQSAAAYHGASHYQPQLYSVIVQYPNIRDIHKRSVGIRFFTTRNWPQIGIQQGKSDAGYFNISSPELTALDLVKYAKSIGGIEVVAEVLDELTDEIQPEQMYQVASMYMERATLQRLGYLFDVILNQQEQANAISQALSGQKLYATPLETGIRTSIRQNPKWRILVTREIQVNS